MTSTNLEVPETWVEAADEMGISTAEYVRRMTQAGRRQFGYDYEASETPVEPKGIKIDGKNSSGIENQLKQWVLRNLSVRDAIDIEELVGLLEQDIVEVADELCDEGQAKYRRSEGGYLKVKNE